MGDPQSSPRALLAEGDVLAGRYRIERSVGRGGMGEVYAAHDQELGETVALKVMSATPDDSALARFRREVRVARRITHVNVARTHDIGEHAGRLFLTMELIEGESLEARLDGRLLAPSAAVEIATAIARGLGAAHEAGVVHRDLKPANVLVEPEGRVAITDFGVARSITEGSKASQIVGTPYYMAPEQIVGEAVEAATDVYALGLVLYEMLTGRLPFEGSASMAGLLARCRETPVDPRRHVAIPDDLAELVLACLELDPAARPRATEVARRLGALGRAAAHSPTVVATAWPSSVPGSVSHPFAPLKLGPRALAVLPFVYRGPADHDHLGDSLAQELIDVLSRNRGVRVLAFGATRANESRDPREVGRALAVEAIVDGSVIASGERVRVSARLLDVESGQQIWSDRFDGDLADVFKMQETMSLRIAETLRAELTVIAHRDRVDAAAMDAYLRGRRELEQRHYRGAMVAVDLLERCLSTSPSFRPAIAAHAIGSVRAWWMAFLESTDRDWASIAKESVARALEQAPELAESHLAAAVYALHLGDLNTTARELAETLAIAPTCADAHRYLGDLQCEAGRVQEGLRRLELALELDPSLVSALHGLARVAALRGDQERFARYLDRAVELSGESDAPIMLMRMREAVWRRDDQRLAALSRHIERTGMLIGPLVAGFARYMLGEMDPEDMQPALRAITSTANARMRSLVGQLVIEAHCHRGDTDHAMRWLRQIGDEALVDVEWLDRCPALEPIRDLPEFSVVVAQARERAQQIWQV